MNKYVAHTNEAFQKYESVVSQHEPHTRHKYE